MESMQLNSNSGFLKKVKTKLIIKHEWQLYLFFLPTLVYFFIFNYIPMYGISIAFKKYSIARGIMESPWIGFTYFEKFISSPMFGKLIMNTIVLSFYNLLIAFPIPVIFALVLNQAKSQKLKKFAQTVTFAPYFISIVVLVGMMFLFFSPSSGVVNVLLTESGLDAINFMGSEEWFRHLFVGSFAWQNTGYQAIVFLAALTAIDMSLYEAATIDGASKLQKIWYVDIPCITPTLVTMLLLRVGRMLNVNFQKALLMQTATNQATSEIIGTYVYKVGLINAQFSYSTAINLFQTMINLILLVTVNRISKKLTEESLW